MSMIRMNKIMKIYIIVVVYFINWFDALKDKSLGISYLLIIWVAFVSLSFVVWLSVLILENKFI